MFVFKAAVVGAGTMGAEIAQLIASAGIPVVLRDVEQGFVDAGMAKAEQLTADRAGSLVASGRLTREQADAQIAGTLALLSATTTYDGFGDVDRRARRRRALVRRNLGPQGRDAEGDHQQPRQAR